MCGVTTSPLSQLVSLPPPIPNYMCAKLVSKTIVSSTTPLRLVCLVLFGEGSNSNNNG